MTENENKIKNTTEELASKIERLAQNLAIYEKISQKVINDTEKVGNELKTLKNGVKIDLGDNLDAKILSLKQEIKSFEKQIENLKKSEFIGFSNVWAFVVYVFLSAVILAGGYKLAKHENEKEINELYGYKSFVGHLTKKKVITNEMREEFNNSKQKP
jgi:hypothetical protein